MIGVFLCNQFWGCEQLYKKEQLFLARLQVFVLCTKSFTPKQGSHSTVEYTSTQCATF